MEGNREPFLLTLNATAKSLKVRNTSQRCVDVHPGIGANRELPGPKYMGAWVSRFRYATPPREAPVNCVLALLFT
jgi:hypothetical protein